MMPRPLVRLTEIEVIVLETSGPFEGVSEFLQAVLVDFGFVGVVGLTEFGGVGFCLVDWRRLRWWQR